MLTVFTAHASTLQPEAKITNYIKMFYSDRPDIYVKLNLPPSLKENAKISHIEFAKIPMPMAMDSA
jgi:hypothetical protein